MWNQFLPFVFLQGVLALIAYDCGHEKINRTRISVLSVKRCTFKSSNVLQEHEDIQLLELTDVTSIHVYQCKINVLQSVYFCGMFSHLSLAAGGLSTFITDLTQEECMKIHQQGIYRLLNNKLLENIEKNATSRYTEIIAGFVDAKGNCVGTSYTYGPNSWENVIVIHAMEFTITDYITTVRLEDNQVILRSNLLCPYLKGKCVDPEYGMNFWDMIPDTSCEALTYNVLYEGNATKIQTLDVTEQQMHIVYTVDIGNVIFALETIKATSVCRYPGFQTEHPRLIIVKKTTGDYIFKTKSTKSLDLFTYINTKFVYVERHIKKQIEDLYAHLIHKKCELERQVLETQLAVAHHHPSEFAFMKMKEPGYTAVSRGEIIYLIRCQAVEVAVRKTDRCYNELAVTYNNKSYFMAPTNHLLQEYGTEIPCSNTLSTAYLLHGAWYGFTPESHRLEPPEHLNPSEDIPWKYEDTHDLIKSGIYTYEATDELRRQIMYPSERKAIENVLTKVIIGHNTDRQNIRLLSSAHLSQIQSYLQGTWSFFTAFGNITSAILGTWFVIRLIKYLASIIINIRIIQNIHGKSWWLLAGICSPLTTYLLHKQARRPHSEPDIQLTSVVTSQTAACQGNETSPISITTIDSPVSTATSINLDTLKQQTRIHPSLKNEGTSLST